MAYTNQFIMYPYLILPSSQKNALAKSILCSLLLLFLFNGCSSSSNETYTNYLFTYFVGNGEGEEAVHYAISPDGYHYYALNNNMPILESHKISVTGGVRDPHILRGEDGTYYMVLTDLLSKNGWTNTAMILLTSKDLISWTSTVIDIPEAYPEKFGNVNRVWAPQTIYDKEKDKYMVYFSMLEPGSYDKIYYAYANEDFNGLEAAPEQLFYSPNEKANIDGDIIYNNGKYHLFYKTEGTTDKGIKVAISDSLTGGYKALEGNVDQTDEAVEGSGVFKLIDGDEYILMYDMYMSGTYQFTKSADLKNFEVVDEDVYMNFHPRHGTVLPITQEETERLLQSFPSTDLPSILSVRSPQAKPINLEINKKDKEIYIPVEEGTDISNFDPQLKMFPGTEMLPAGAQDFSGSPVSYVLHTLNGKEENYKVNVQIANNPVLKGYYADPEIIYSEKNQKYYLYPTSDGFTSWSGNYFKTFSSKNLVHWEDEGTILDLKKDVSWANRNAWAPTMVETKIDGNFKYFYYFTAAQKIGVAYSKEPTGPFKDSGSALIDFKPDGITGGQEIDPDVFIDPKTGTPYLYWGNGYLAVAELNPDMLSIKKETVKVLTPDDTFREGAEIIYRNGTYYFLWSQDDTRSPDYRVRYAKAKSPLGPLEIPENNLVIKRDDNLGIYGTGHNSVIQVPDSDEWYLVYHRFNRPKGITMGDAAGYNREVCIDKLTFDSKGNINEAQPTLEGIDPLR